MLKDRRVVTAIGMGVALLAGLVIAVLVIWRQPPDVDEVGSQSGLVVETGRADDSRLDPAHPLRCFVDGKSIGELPLSECARRNGVATGALDVGLDPSGALAAGPAGAASHGELTPLPPDEEEMDAPVRPQAAEPAATPLPAPEADSPPTPALEFCWRYGDGAWSRLPDVVSLQACVQALFAGQCQPPGVMAYGRWGSRTLRLLGSTVQVSADGRTFRPLSQQATNCVVAPQER
jgi:hypothetical protein